MQPASLLATINEQLGTTIALAERNPDGESRTGAYAVIDATGRRGVLKGDPDSNPALVDRLREIGAATARLREHGYPAPLYWVVGRTSAACYSIQEILPLVVEARLKGAGMRWARPHARESTGGAARRGVQ